MKILVTGAAGFIGSHLSKNLANKGFEVFGIDNFADYYSPNYKKLRVKEFDLESSCHFRYVDLLDYQSVEKIFKMTKPNYIIHLAAQAGIRLPLIKNMQYIDSNVSAYLNVIRASINSNVTGIMYASSSSVYGDDSPIPFTENSLLLRPKSLYGVTKLMNEQMSRVFSQLNNIKFRGLRFFTVYGPWGRPDMAYFKLASASLGEYDFSLFGDGSTKRDFTNIDDVVACSEKLLIEFMERDSKSNDIVNIGGSDPKSINQLIEEFRKHQETDFELVHLDAITQDSLVTVANHDYMFELIGPHQFKPLEVGVAELITWAKKPSIKNNLASWIDSTY